MAEAGATIPRQSLRHIPLQITRLPSSQRRPCRGRDQSPRFLIILNSRLIAKALLSLPRAGQIKLHCAA